MPDEQTEVAAHEDTHTNGVQPDRAKLTRAEQDAADRAAFLAGEDEEDIEEAPAPKKAPKKPADADEDEDEDELDNADDDLEEVADDDEEDDLELDDDEDVEADEDDDEDAGDGKQDPDLAKRLAKVQKYEKKVRDQATAREKQFVQERDAFIAEWKPKIEEYEKFEKLKSSKSNVAGVLKALGYTEDDFEEASKILWGLSKTGGADPKNRDAVTRMQRERELREQVDAANKRAEAIEAKLAKQETDAEANQKLEAYLGRITKAIGDETPLVKKRMELAPKSTRKAIEKVAYDLAKKAGGLVDPKRVARAYEKKLDRTVDQASKLRGDSAAGAAATKPKPKAKPAITVVDKTKKPAVVAASAKKLIPDRDDMIERLRMIERGELDPDADEDDAD